MTTVITSVAMAFPSSAWAYDLYINNIYYDYNEGHTELTVVTASSSSGSYSGDVVIPESVTYAGVEYPVTAIATHAFSRSASMHSIQIPNTIRTIGDHAFTYCTGLNTIEIPNSVTSMGRCVFHSCITTQCSRCSATGLSVTTSRKVLSIWHGSISLMC